MGRLVSNGHVALNGLMFDYFLFSPFMVTIGFLRSKASIHPHIYDDVVIHVLVKEDVSEFIGH